MKGNVYIVSAVECAPSVSCSLVPASEKGIV